MQKHEPPGYICPFCRLVQGQDDEINQQDNIIFQDEEVIAFVSSKSWQKNPGNVLVIPKEHVENLYDISDELLASVYKTVKKVAIAIKETYKCDGTSTRQHNEPAGNQNVWHFHAHVFPRYDGDDLYTNHHQTRWLGREEKMEYVKKLKYYFSKKI